MNKGAGKSSKHAADSSTFITSYPLANLIPARFVSDAKRVYFLGSVMKTYLYIAIGAVAGAIARYQLGVWVTQWRGTSVGFPWGTLLINVSGSLLLGFLFRSFRSGLDNRNLQALLGTGFCGAYTTFSTFSLETINLMLESHTPTALLYVGISMVMAPAACFVGYLLAGVME